MANVMKRFSTLYLSVAFVFAGAVSHASLPVTTFGQALAKNTMLLIDNENRVILDYMLNALP